MSINIHDIVHSYDIRGLYPSQLNEDLYFNIAKVLVDTLGVRVAIGYDYRTSSISLKKAMIEGFLASNGSVTDLGLISTEITNFVAGKYKDDFDFVCTVTASHNPKGYNGLKVVKSGGGPFSKSAGLLDVVEKAMKKIDSGYQITGEELEVNKLEGLWSSYYEYLINASDTENLKKKYRILVDPGNGVGAYALKKSLADHPNIDFEYINEEPREDSISHEANPQKAENLEDLRIAIKNSDNAYDFGVAFDGDADRLVFVDSAGEVFLPFFSGVALGKYYLENNKEGTVLYDNRLRLAYNDLELLFPNRVMINKAGRSNFFNSMQEKSAGFAAEATGHYYYKDFFFTDTAFLSLLYMIKLVESGETIDSMRKEYSEQYKLSGEVNYVVEDKDLIIEKLKDHYQNSDVVITQVDGVEVTTKDWGFNLRKSNTEPLIRLNVEARQKSVMLEKFKEIESIIDGKRENLPLWQELV